MIRQHAHILWIGLSIWIGLSSCNREDAPDCLQSAGEARSEQRALDSFSQIELRDYIQYELKDSTWYGVEITAPGNLIPEIQTEVENGKLTVSNANSCNFVRSYKNRIRVRICAPDFRDIQNYATGDIFSVNTINGVKFSIDNRGAAGLQQFHVLADTVNIASHTGVSDTKITGGCDVVYLFSQGLGIIDSRHLNANYAFVNNSSLNDVFVSAVNYLFAYIRFSGDIHYFGSPQYVDEDVAGTGSVIAN